MVLLFIIFTPSLAAVFELIRLSSRRSLRPAGVKVGYRDTATDLLPALDSAFMPDNTSVGVRIIAVLGSQINAVRSPLNFRQGRW